jgi:hypothetical protein
MADRENPPQHYSTFPRVYCWRTKPVRWGLRQLVESRDSASPGNQGPPALQSGDPLPFARTWSSLDMIFRTVPVPTRASGASTQYTLET